MKKSAQLDKRWKRPNSFFGGHDLHHFGQIYDFDFSIFYKIVNGHVKSQKKLYFIVIIVNSFAYKYQGIWSSLKHTKNSQNIREISRSSSHRRIGVLLQVLLLLLVRNWKQELFFEFKSCNIRVFLFSSKQGCNKIISFGVLYNQVL